MNIWTIESNPLKQTLFTWAMIMVGMVLVYGFRHYDGSYVSNSLAGFLLGVLLLSIGIPGLFMIGKQTITVDGNSGHIVIEDVKRFVKKKTMIYFRDIADVHVSELGNRSEGSVSYYVTLTLKSGKVHPLFFPAYYDGRWDRSIAESRCRQLQETLKL